MKNLTLISILFAFGTAACLFADDSAECGKKGELSFTVSNKGYDLYVQKEKIKSKPTIIKALNRKGEEVIEEEFVFNVDNGTSVKKLYEIQNWRHCGDQDDVRVRIYDAFPDRKVFV